MTLNSRKSTFLCVFIATHHSFCFPNVLWRGVSRPQRPPLDPPLHCQSLQSIIQYNDKISLKLLSYISIAIITRVERVAISLLHLLSFVGICPIIASNYIPVSHTNLLCQFICYALGCLVIWCKQVGEQMV